MLAFYCVSIMYVVVCYTGRRSVAWALKSVHGLDADDSVEENHDRYRNTVIKGQERTSY